MRQQNTVVARLFKLRNQYSPGLTAEKEHLLRNLHCEQLKSREMLNTCYSTLLFLLAYPDNKTVYSLSKTLLGQLEGFVKGSENNRVKLFNTGVIGSQVCAEFGFAMVKYLKAKYKEQVYIDSITEPTGQMRSVISVVMPAVESEIMQDENTTWQLWMKKWIKPGEDLLDALIAVFEQSPIRPEVKDELWTALGIYITVDAVEHLQLPERLIKIHYHNKILKTHSLAEKESEKPLQVKLSESEAERILECGRMVLVHHLREIDPVTFSSPSLVSYYQLTRGLSIALFGMTKDRRRPIDCYMGYVVFKNGLPLAYAGSWILFDSGRIGLNVFSPYRGGESMHTFEQILKAHKYVYRLNRFSVDPYQIGKHNSDGIKSGAFWLYYKMGFRPILPEQKLLAESEHQKQLSAKGYRSPAVVLNKFANSRLEINLGSKKAVDFDATDLSLVYFNIVQKKYAGNREMAQQDSLKRLSALLKLSKTSESESIQYIMRNWCVILMRNESGLRGNKPLIEVLKKAFVLKAHGSEEDYMRELQRSVLLKKFIEGIIKEHILP